MSSQAVQFKWLVPEVLEKKARDVGHPDVVGALRHVAERQGLDPETVRVVTRTVGREGTTILAEAEKA